jgi:hypothetical protein
VGPQFRAWRRAANKEQREHHHNHNAELIDEGEQVRVEVTGLIPIVFKIEKSCIRGRNLCKNQF